ncbi:MAG TPA: hypothetical protein VNA65_01050 [Candidatus Dormibacteraeota bacterium]|nr:hypothetical protein [Candidatus Dormibacteraeota bacterium]
MKKPVEDVADLHWKDLEVYRGETPPSGYAIEEEMDAIDRFADANGLDRFHLVFEPAQPLRAARADLHRSARAFFDRALAER